MNEITEMVSDVVLVIQKYYDEYLFLPKNTWPKEEFLVRSTSRWAVNELLSRITYSAIRLPSYITGRENITPDVIIKNFIEETDYYAHMANSISSAFMFTVARDTAKDILNIIYERT